MKTFIGGTSVIDLYKGDVLVASGKSFTDSSITISNSASDVRGGQGNKLYGKYFHDGKFALKIEDALFNLDYMSMVLGGSVSIGGDVATQETNIAITSGTGTIQGTPVAFGKFGVIGYVSIPNKNDWHKVTFTGKTFTSPFDASVKVVTVKYTHTNDATKRLTVFGNIIPDTVHAIMHAQLFAGEDTGNASNTTKIGEVQINIPRLQLDGNETLSLTSNNVAKTPLAGEALVVDSDSIEDESYFGTIDEIIYDAKWSDYAAAICIANGDDDIDLVVGHTETIDVMIVPKNGAPSLVSDPTTLTFASADATKASVSTSGVVTAVAAGSTTISVKCTANPNLSAIARVTVTAS